jgi:hypothetical protein
MLPDVVARNKAAIDGAPIKGDFGWHGHRLLSAARRTSKIAESHAI